MRRTTISLIFISAFLFSTSALAAEPNTLVVTATKTEAPISTIGSSVSVLTDKDIQNLGVTFVNNALRTLPGIAVSQSGGPGGLSSVRIRGEPAYRSVVLLDGIRIDDPSGTQVATNFANLLVGDVARIEVVRGPQSLLYGADAIGGVIQIFTRRPEPGFHAEGTVSAGAYRTLDASGRVLYGRQRAGLVLASDFRETHGFTAKVGDPALGDADGQRDLNLHGIVTGDLSDTLSFEAVAHFTHAYDSFDGSSAFPPYSPADPKRLLKTNALDGRIALTDKALYGRLTTRISFASSDIQRDDLDNGQPYIYGSRFDGGRHTYGLLSTFVANPSQTFVFGAEHDDITAKTDSFAKRAGRSGIYGEWEGSFLKHLYLSAGLRYDQGDTFKSRISGRGTLALLLAPISGEQTRLHASYGTGFRAPSLYEQATNAAASLPRLSEETSNGFDAGVSQTLFGGHASLDVTYFRQSIDHEIRYDNINFTGYFQEAGTTTSQGVEVAGHADAPIHLGPLTGIAFQTALTYTDAHVHSPDAENGLPRIRQPRYMTASTLTFKIGKDRADLAMTLRTAADTEDGFSFHRVRLPDYQVVDLAARYRLTKAIELFVHGVNILDEQYQEVAGYATSDAALYAGVRARL